MDRKQVLTTRDFDLSVSNYGTTRQHQYDLAVLPWGATEPHNYHLPYLTDCILSHDIAIDAAFRDSEEYGMRAMGTTHHGAEVIKNKSKNVPLSFRSSFFFILLSFCYPTFYRLFYLFLYFSHIFLPVLKRCFTFATVKQLAMTYPANSAQQRNFDFFAFFSTLYLVVSDILLTHTHTHRRY